MRSTLFHDGEINDAVTILKHCLKTNTVVPLDVYTCLENYGILIGDLIKELEKEIHGESEIYDSDWGC
jgi:hypothetical protein